MNPKPKFKRGDRVIFYKNLLNFDKKNKFLNKIGIISEIDNGIGGPRLINLNGGSIYDFCYIITSFTFDWVFFEQELKLVDQNIKCRNK
jgi:hypothetical protein